MFLDVSQSVNSKKKKDIFELSDDSNYVSYDSDKDPLWKIDKNQIMLSMFFYNINKMNI